MRYSVLKTSDEENPALGNEVLERIPAPRRFFFLSNRTCLIRDLLVALCTLILAGGLQWAWKLSSENGVTVLEIARKHGIVEEIKASWDLTLGKSTPYTNGTSEDMDAMWDSITAPPGKVGNIKVQKEDLKSMGDVSVAFADDSGYLVTVDVFHQLHCLDYLRRRLLPTNAPFPEEDEVVMMHLRHCVDSLRSYIQCHADTSLITFKWLANYPSPFPDFRTTHQCYDWDQIHKWAMSQSVEAEPSQFVHPELGPFVPGRFTSRPSDLGMELHFLPMKLE